MAHVKRKLNDSRLNFKNCLHEPTDKKIGTLTATYSAPKIGSPMVVHPTNPNLQRQFTVQEHCRIRRLPESLAKVIMSIAQGTHPLVSVRGSTTAAHRLNGNSVSANTWRAVGLFIGNYLSSLSKANNYA
jgi:DNA (cytosine-5)-methyltransferase 1